MNEDISTVAGMLNKLRRYSELFDDHIILDSEPDKDYFPAEAMQEAAAWIEKLKSQVDELLPYMQHEVNFAVKIGPAEEGHDDNCEDCMWYARMMEMKARCDSGEFTH
jgi:hypothetical protein